MALNPEPLAEKVSNEETFIETGQPAPSPRPSIASLISQAVEQFFKLIKAEIELAKTRFKQAAQKMAGGIGLILVAVLLIFVLLLWIFHSIELALALLVPGWAAALITTGLILLIIVIFAALGLVLIKKGAQQTPDVSGAVQADIEVMTEGLSK